MPQPNALPSAPTPTGKELVMVQQPGVTAVAAASNGVNTATFAGAGVLHVGDTGNAQLSGQITVQTLGTPAVIAYTSLTPTSYVGCTTIVGGGVLQTGGTVVGRVQSVPVASIGGVEASSVVAASGALLDLDYSVASKYQITMTANTEFFFINAVNGRSCEIETTLVWNGSGPWQPVWQPGVVWSAGVPTFNTNAFSNATLKFVTYNGGGTWWASIKSMTPLTAPTAPGTTFVDGQILIASSGANQVLDFSLAAGYTILQDANCTLTFKGLTSRQQEMVVNVIPIGDGQWTTTVSGVTNWLRGALPNNKSNPVSAPLQTGMTSFVFKTYASPFGTGISCKTEPSEPIAPDVPLHLTGTPTTTSVALSWQIPRILGDDAVTSIAHYTVTVQKTSDHSAVGSPVTVTGATNTTISGLTSNTSYDFFVTANTTAHGDGLAAKVTIVTLVSASTVPGTPNNFAATSDSLSTKLTWTVPSTNGGSAITSYKATVTGPAGGAPTQVQKLSKRVVGSLSASIGPADGLAALTPGNKLIVVVGDMSWTGGTGGRTVTSTSATLSQYVAVDNSDQHEEIWDHDIASGEGTPTIAYTLGAGASVSAGVTITVIEMSGLGARDKSAQGPQRFNVTHFQTSHTAPLVQADTWALAAFSIGADNPTVTYVNDDGASPTIDTSDTLDTSFTDTAASGWTQIVANTRQFIATFHNTSGTAALSLAAKLTVAETGIGCMATWRSNVASFTHTDTGIVGLTDTVVLPADGVIYTVQLWAVNINGQSATPATASVFHSTTGGGGGGGAGVIPSTRGTIAGSGDPTQTDWTNEMNAITALTPTGTMSMPFIFQGVAGLASSPGEATAWGAWDFFVHAGATPRPAIFIYLADTGLIQQPGANVSLADMAGASPSGTAAQQNAYNRMNAVASYFSNAAIKNQNPIFRLGWEMDQGWNEWTSVGNTANFIAAYRKAHDIIKAQCPTAIFDFNVSAGCGGGAFTWNHTHTFWDSFYPGTAYVDIIGLDIYGDIPKSVAATSAAAITWYTAELAMFQAWATGLGKPISCPEWGISSPNFYTGVQSANTSFNIAVIGTDFVQMMYTWFIGLPASGAGRLYYQNVFDGYSGAATGWRGLRNVPTYGTAAANKYKALFNA